jgi:hypothetical protein
MHMHARPARALPPRRPAWPKHGEDEVSALKARQGRAPRRVSGGMLLCCLMKCCRGL